MDGFQIKYVQKNKNYLSFIEKSILSENHNASLDDKKVHKEHIEKNSRDKAIIDQVTQNVKKINESLELINTRVIIDVDPNTGKTIFKIINAENGEVIKQVPPETMLKISAQIAEYMDKEANEGKENLVNKKI